MKSIPLLVTAALLLGAAGSSLAKQGLSAPEQALYAGDFKKANALIEAGLASETDRTVRFRLLQQRVRVQQVARLSGLPDQAELAALAVLKAAASQMPKNLQAEARHLELVSTYFRRITDADKGDFLSLQPAFQTVARELSNPCQKADALFFGALMPQMQGKVADSAAGLEQARRAATAAGCDLEVSYALRHLAVVEEEKDELAKAAKLAAQSLAIRRRIKFEVFLPFSLLHSADIAEKRGDSKGAKAFRNEALSIAERLRLPAQKKAAKEALALATD